MKKTALLLLALAASACTPANEYQPPQGKHVAILTGHTVRPDNVLNVGPDWAYTEIRAVDNQPVTYGAFGKIGTDYGFSPKSKSEIPLLAGTHTITMHTEFNNGFFGVCPCNAITSVKGKFISGKRYRVVSSVDGADVKTWIVDEQTNATVSDIGSGNYRRSPRDVVVPVFVPAK